MSVLPRILLVWGIALGVVTVLLGLVSVVPVHRRKGVDFLCCQDNNSYTAYRWLSQGMSNTYFILDEMQKFVRADELELCAERREGIWGWLFGRNKPKEKGFLSSAICDTNMFLVRHKNPVPSPKRWFQHAYELGPWGTTKTVLRKSVRGFKKAWAYFVDVPIVQPPPPVTQNFLEVVADGIMDFGLFSYLNLLAIGGGVWIISVVVYKQLQGWQEDGYDGLDPREKVPLIKAIVAKYYAHKLIKTGKNFHMFHLISRKSNTGVFMTCLRKDATKAARIGLRRAYKATKALQHSNIVRFVDWMEGINSFGLGLELASFGNLRDAISGRASTVPFVDKASIFKQVLSAVNFLHKSDVAHLNIRPGSVLVFDKWFCVKLSGFSNAIKNPHDQPCSRYDLHPISIPNEAINREPYDPFKADIWALGSLFFYILVGDFFQKEIKLPLRRVLFPALKGCDNVQKKTIIVLLAGLLSGEPSYRPGFGHILDKLNTLQ